MRVRVRNSLIAAVISVVSLPVIASAQTADVDFTQTINPGVLTTSFRDAGNSLVASPSFGLNATSVSTVQQTVTGTFGSSSQRITVDNPGAANAGWTLTIAATDGEGATWSSGSNTYDFNSSAAEGQLTLNPSVATLTATSPATTTGIALGTQATFTAATPISLLSAAAGSDDVWNGYITGVGVSQTIPASQPAGSYTFSLTQTVTAV